MARGSLVRFIRIVDTGEANSPALAYSLMTAFS